MRKRKPAQPRGGKGEPIAKGHHATLLAVYCGKAASGRQLKLNVHGRDARAAQLTFLPLAEEVASSSWLGLLENRSGYRLRASVLEVSAAEAHDAEPVTALIAGKLPKSVAHLPGPVLKGFAKSVVRASADLGQGGDVEARWRTALTLALDGEIQPDRAGAFNPMSAGSGGESAAFEVHEGRVVWVPFVERLADELEERAVRFAERNPFVEGVSTAKARELLSGGSTRMAGLVLECAAKRRGWTKGSLLGETFYSFGDKSDGRPKPNDHTAAQKILQFVEQGEGGLEQLRVQFKRSPNVIAWLLDAGRLVCAPDGFLFTADELMRYWKELKLESGGDVPGVKELKDRLDLGRRKAEGLRQLMLARRSRVERAASAGAGS